MWRTDWERLTEVTSVSPTGWKSSWPAAATTTGQRERLASFSFSVAELRIAGAGDLLIQIERRRQALADDGLLDRQRELARPLLPRTIAIVCGAGAKAGEDVLAALHPARLHGRIVWAFAPVRIATPHPAWPRRCATSC